MLFVPPPQIVVQSYPYRMSPCWVYIGFRAPYIQLSVGFAEPRVRCRCVLFPDSPVLRFWIGHPAHLRAEFLHWWSVGIRGISHRCVGECVKSLSNRRSTRVTCPFVACFALFEFQLDRQGLWVQRFSLRSDRSLFSVFRVFLFLPCGVFFLYSMSLWHWMLYRYCFAMIRCRLSFAWVQAGPFLPILFLLHSAFPACRF